MTKKLIIGLILAMSNLIYLKSQQITEPYDFPVRPGTKEWSDLKTQDERFKALQLPDEILSNMSTSALVISCLNFPAFGDFIAYNDVQTGYDIVASKFNGLRALVERNDAPGYLIEIYQKAGRQGFKDSSLNLDEEFWPIKFSWIELMLAQNNIVSLMRPEDKKKLLNISMGKLIIGKSGNDKSAYGLGLTIFLMARVLHSLDYEEFERYYNENNSLKIFIQSARSTDSQIIDNIIRLTNNYLNE